MCRRVPHLSGSSLTVSFFSLGSRAPFVIGLVCFFVRLGVYRPWVAVTGFGEGCRGRGPTRTEAGGLDRRTA